MSNGQPSKSSGKNKNGVYYLITIISGGVVGHDYATGINVNPIVGTLLGMLFSFIATKLLVWCKNNEKHIEKYLSRTGGVIGAIVGVWSTASHDATGGVIITGLVLGIIAGVIAGQVLAGMVVFSAMLVLLVSRGPIGIVLKQILSHKESGGDSLGFIFDQSDNLICLVDMTNRFVS